jgi:small ligand-binding sensory domain FIST
MTTDRMRFASAISDAANAQEAAEAVCRQLLEQLQGRACDLACLFASPIYRTGWPELVSRIHDRLRPRVLLGCSGSGVIGGGQELEWVPALSMVAARLPGVQLHPFAVSPEELEGSSPGGFWVDKIGASPEAQPVFILIADPYTTQPAKLIAELNATYRTRPMVGGLVSGGNEPGEHLIFLDRHVRREGAVGVALAGNITMDTVISQGCRPIGRPYVVTRAEEHAILALGGRPALAVLHAILSSLPLEDRELAQQGSVFVGLVIDEMRRNFSAGDFLIRNIVGIDPDAGAVVVADQVAVGQSVQFQLRDPATSRQELRRLLQRLPPAAISPPAGALFFNCTGRGRALYGTANQDIRTIQMISGKLPVGGFFCNGEIGPVGGTNLLHGYTASLGLFRPMELTARGLDALSAGQPQPPS